MPRRPTSAFEYYVDNRKAALRNANTAAAGVAEDIHNKIHGKADPNQTAPEVIPMRQGMVPTARHAHEKNNRPAEFDIDYYPYKEMDILCAYMGEDKDGNPCEPITGPDGAKAEKIQAAADFNVLESKDVTKSSKDFWSRPILYFAWTSITIEMFLYFIVRRAIVWVERIAAFWHPNAMLEASLANAPSYHSWVATAIDLDDKSGYDSWKRVPANPYYDAEMISKVVANLKEQREAGESDGVKTILEVCLRNDFCGTESWRIYASTYYGTKDLVEEYVDEVERCIQMVSDAPEEEISMLDKAKFFKATSKAYGSTVLALSGGATMGWYHLGVIRALLDAGLLPRILTGASAGSWMSALVCTRTDEELDKILIPELYEKLALADEPFSVWYPRMKKTGARFCIRHWAKSLTWITRGNMTFKEAYDHTGRVFNVAVTPSNAATPPKVLNYLTAPNCAIFSACMASAAAPGFVRPVSLLYKNPDGSFVPWTMEGTHRDGSIAGDIPMKSLNLLFNCNYSIVCQVNPHIHWLCFSGAGAAGQPNPHKKEAELTWRGGFLLSALERLIKLDLMKNLRLLRDLELSENVGSMLQKFDGCCTILPNNNFRDLTRVMTDPDRDELERIILNGQRATWPSIHMIDNRLRIERQIDLGREAIREKLYESKGDGIVHFPASEIEESAQEKEDEKATETIPSPEIARKRRQTLAKLGLSDANPSNYAPPSSTGGGSKIGSYLPTTSADPEAEPSKIADFTTAQEKVVRRLSKMPANGFDLSQIKKPMGSIPEEAE